MAEHHILNLGAGVQSTTLFLLAREGRLRCDVAIFADTGDEPAAVYRHLEVLRGFNLPPILVRSAGVLSVDLIQGRGESRRFVSIPAFTRGPDGKVGRIRRQCTAEYKVQVIEQAIRRDVLGLQPRQRIPRGTRIVQYFGLSAEEAGRAARVAARFANRANAEAQFPLLDMGWSRSDCQKFLAERLPHTVPRSACAICPFRSDVEWIALQRTDPAAWQRAVALDQVLRNPASACSRGFRQQLFLHRSCLPLAEVKFAEQPKEYLSPWTAECEGHCGV